MHPDHLPVPTTSRRVLRVLLSAPLRLLWTLLALVAAQSALLHLAPSVASAANDTLPGALKNALVATAVLWGSLWLLEGKGLAKAGLGLTGAPGSFARGYLLGAALLSVVTGTLALAGSYRVEGLGGGASARALGHAALLFLLVGVFEEVLARGIVFRLLEEAFGSVAALAISSFLFGLAHRFNPGASWQSSLAIALEAGVLLGAAYVATRSLWLPIGLHAAWDFFEGPVYGAHISGLTLPSLLQARLSGPAWLTGGAFGPEAGLPALLWGTALGGAFFLLAQRRGQLKTPRWLRRLLRRDGRRQAMAVPKPLAPPATS